MNTSRGYTDLEYEVIGLKVAIDTIDSMVNHQMLQFLGAGSRMETRFPTDSHQKLFYILLTDFLSRKTEASLLPGELSVLEQLGVIVGTPALEKSKSATKLKSAHKVFSEWLAKEVKVEVWASSLNLQLSLPLTRQDIVYFAGNMSKHHFGHLSAVIGKIYKLMDDQNRPRHDLIPALESVYEQLHDNILNYHGSAISEMLNNIRWGIHDYLEPEFNRTYRKTDGIFYEFEIPEEIKADFARSCYWDLMNSVRGKPYINRFTVNEILKLRY
jgi:hypothetical protein